MSKILEEIRQHDWCAPIDTGPYFIEESALDNSTIEKILRNKFYDPLISSEEDDGPNEIDWDKIFKSANFKKTPNLHVPGMKPTALYPKLSSLTGLQHFQCLKVLCAKNPQVLKGFNINRPTYFDRKTFEELQETYEQEKKEYIEWAKSLWVSQHCILALRPKPVIENIYETEFKVRAHRLSGYPKKFNMRGQIGLDCNSGYQYELRLQSTLVDVNISELPQANIPEQITENISIINTCSLPEPCHKHPYQFILPTENAVTVLPIKEVHRELAQYAIENNARIIASENALSCLMEFNRYWTIPVSVYSTYNIEGEKCNVTVLDSEFFIHKEPAVMRTFKAFTHLLENAFIPTTEIEKIIEKSKKKNGEGDRKRKLPTSPKKMMQVDADLSTDDEPLGLTIIEDDVDDAKKNRKKKGKDNEKWKLPTSSKKRIQVDAELSSDNEPGLTIIEDDLDDAKKSRKKKGKDNEKRKLPTSPKKRIQVELSSDDEPGLAIIEDDLDDAKKSRKKKGKDNEKWKLPTSSKKSIQVDAELSSDNESGLTIIEDDLDDAINSDREDSKDKIKTEERNTEKFACPKHKNKLIAKGDISMEDINDIIGVYSCTCTDTLFEVPPRRSFKKWRLINKNEKKDFDVIVHCSHKARLKSRELILEPIPEYQLELGASQQTPDRLRSLALSLMLRKKASVVNVRVDGCNGDVVTIDTVTDEQHSSQHREHWQHALNVLHTTLAELKELNPGDYLLKHEPCHGSNALLFVHHPAGELSVQCDSGQLAEPDESKMVRTQPILTDQLLPYHKYRKILPCAFTPFDYMVAKETKKPPTKQKTPPQALKWPKRRNRKRNKK